MESKLAHAEQVLIDLANNTPVGQMDIVAAKETISEIKDDLLKPSATYSVH
jgi:hypothetical protein